MDDFKGDRPSHLFVRFNTIEPGIRAAHVAYARVRIENGEVEKDEELPPLPIDYDTEDFRALMSKAQADAISGSLRLAVELEAERKTVLDLKAAADNDQAKIAHLEAVVADLTAQLEGRSPVVNGVPQIVPMNRARKALALGGLLQVVEDAVAAAAGQQGELIRIDWEYAEAIRRDSLFVAAMMGAIGMTDQQADALFIAAASLP